MSNVKIITDSCSSLTKEQLIKLGVDYLEMTFSLDEDCYNAFESPYTDPNMFYEKLKSANKCSTGCINPQMFYEKFEKYAKDGIDVVYMGLSSGLSSTFSNAVLASNQINQKYGHHIYVADSLTGSYSVAYMVETSVKMANEGYSALEIFNKINKNKINNVCYFIPSDLQFLKKCGRISKVVASVGSLLNIVPMLTPDENGKLKLCSKSIGKKRAYKTLCDEILKNIDLTSKDKIYIGHTGLADDAEEIKQYLLKNTKNKEIVVGHIDYTMACCCGPKTLAVSFIVKK